MSEYLKEDSWWVSPYNFVESAPKLSSGTRKIEVHDATLRDGEQTPGVVFNRHDKLRIAEMLAEAGADRIEAGMPAVSAEDMAAIKLITSNGLKSKIFTFARALTNDIDAALECGAYGVIVEVPIGYPKLKYQFGWTWEDVLRKSVDCVNYAKNRGLYVTYFPYDTTRARESDLNNLLSRIILDAKPDSVGLVDTMGCASPEAIKYLVKLMSDLTKLPIEIHTHNDFGLAVATELAAAAAGASVLHTCVNGLGERTGNAAFEEIVLALKLLYGYDGNFRLEKIPELCAAVAEASNIQPHGNKPVVGSRNYTRESGIGVNLVVEKPLAMFAVAPSVFGRTGEVVLGKKSGKLSVEYKLRELGIELAEEKKAEALEAVKEFGSSKLGLVSDEDFIEICKKLM